MKLVVGLGNPGEKYQHTRHNVGFIMVEALAEKLGEQIIGMSWRDNKKFAGKLWQTKELILLKPQTFMNESGRSVSEVVHFYKLKLEDVYIIYDDLDIELSKYKLQFNSGPKVHNGLGSVRSSLGTNKFWQVRIGVENRRVRGNQGVPGVEYSLQNFNKTEQAVIEKVKRRVIEKLVSVVS